MTDVFPADLRRVVVVLVKPTHYDDDGFPYRFLRGVLPSNSLAAMNTLTRAALDRELPSHIAREVHVLEDGVESHARRLDRLLRRFPRPGTRLIVGLVGVQTAQFPRACDLIDRWQARGATCVIGGFHVSGAIATMLDGVEDPRRPDFPCPHTMPAEIQALLDRGVVVFHGEAEAVWADALRDIIAGQPKPLYRGGHVSLAEAPLPEYPDDYFDHSFVTAIRTFDTSRGCPFLCSFCSIINVHGRRARCRPPEAIVTRVAELCRQEGKARFFFTDDNFARNPRWEEILDGLIALRERGDDVEFLVQADLACNKVPRFLDKLSRAGCGQIFMGVESMNPANLAAAGKRQNHVEEYARVWSECQARGISVHAGYIIGFPHDTAESVAEDVAALMQMGADQASFFMLTPLTGCEDHARLVAAGADIDPDLSKQDSFHAVVDHPQMSRAEWQATYEKAWRTFYTVPQMLAALRRCPTRAARLDLLRNFMWNRWSVLTERTHPMIAGFYRLRPYQDRRSDAAPLSFARYLVSEVVRHLRYLPRFLAEFYLFQYLTFESDCAAAAERQPERRSVWQRTREWFGRTFGPAASRRWLNRFWIDYARKRWQLLWNPLPHLRAMPFAFTEVIYTLRFACRLSRLVMATTA